MSIVVAPATRYQPGTTVSDDVFGDSAGTISNTALAQTFIFDASSSHVYGDALNINGTGRGGADTLTVFGLAGDPTVIVGDAGQLLASAKGGKDLITALGNSATYGDALDMTGSSLGGNDHITVSSSSTVFSPVYSEDSGSGLL